MSYNVKLQTLSAYKKQYYGSGTIYDSACGPASLCNALMFLGLANISVPDMCKIAVNCGARINGAGTVMAVLLRNTADKYGFTYKTTSKNAELWEHLKNGGVAIMNNGSQYKLFSSGGHYVTAFKCEGTSTVYVADSYWTSGKYTSTSLRRNNVKVVETGVVRTSLTQCGKATIDRSPSYYLISKKPVTFTNVTDTSLKPTTNLNVREGPGTTYRVIGALSTNDTVKALALGDNGWYRINYNNGIGYVNGKYTEKIINIESSSRSQEEEDEMKYYERLEDVPEWYKPAVQKLVDKNALIGIGGGVLHLSEDLCRTLTILNALGVLDK